MSQPFVHKQDERRAIYIAITMNWCSEKNKDKMYIESTISDSEYGGVGNLIEKPEGFPTRPPPTAACLPAGGKGLLYIYIKKSQKKHVSD